MAENTPTRPEQALAKGLFAKDLVGDLRNPPPPGPRPDYGAGDNLFKSADDVPPPPLFDVIIEFNEGFERGVSAARLAFFRQFKSVDDDLLKRLYREAGYEIGGGLRDFEFATTWDDRVYIRNSLATRKYVFAILTLATLENIARASAAYEERHAEKGAPRGKQAPIHRIWKDHVVEKQVYQSSCTIKADAARLTFSTSGKGIIWAVADSGILATHPHFQTHNTLDLPAGMEHRDFTQLDDKAGHEAAWHDDNGHGTHIAGIIAGETRVDPPKGPGVGKILIHSQVVDDDALLQNPVEAGGDEPVPMIEKTDVRKEGLSGVAPQAKLLSLKVLDKDGTGRVSYLIAAIAYIRKLNTNNQENRIHGVNMSLGYLFDTDVYGAGQSPVCREVNSLVQAGVCVVAAAGNAGGDTVSVRSTTSTVAYICSIADPGNADKAITVGSTHREKPHQYGVSFFSSKGPTLDGRMKPDLVAPGERIVSCDAVRQAGAGTDAAFCEMSGTSQATAHVSGAIAALMAWRSEFRNNPDAVKALLTETATDLKRVPAFQGAGMIDVMRAFLKV